MCSREAIVMTIPKVSICIPAYKQVDYLRRTLESVQKQKFQDYEIILTDDSPDDSVKKLVDTFDFEGKLKYFKNINNLGTPENWNKAVRLATGEYIKILHHDDWFTDENSLVHFAKMLDDHPEADFGFSSTLVWRVDTDTKRVHKATKQQLEILFQNPESLFFGNIIGSPSATIYRNTVEKEYDPLLKWVVDWDFYIRVLKQNNNFAFCPQPLICTPDGLAHQVTQACINNREVQLFEHFHVLNKINHKGLELKPFINYLANSLIKYNIKSLQDLKSLNIDIAIDNKLLKKFF